MLVKLVFDWLHKTIMLSLNRKSYTTVEPTMTATIYLYSGHLSTMALCPLTLTLMISDLCIAAHLIAP